MIKKGFFSFLRCLKYYFVPLGILSIFTIIGLSISATGIVNVLKSFFEEVKNIVSAAKIDWNGIWGALIGEVSKLHILENPNQALSTLFSSDWITNTLMTVAKATFGDSISFEQIGAVINAAIASIIVFAIIFLALIVIGIVVGIFVVKLLLRKEMTRVRIGKLIVVTLLDTLFWLALIVIYNLLSALAAWVAIVLIVLIVLGFMFICLIEAYLFYGRKHIKFGKVVNIINVLKLYAIELMVFAVTASMTILLVFIFKFFVGLYLALPIIEIGIIANSLEAENYVVNMVDEVNQPSDFILRGNYEKKI